MLGRLIMIALVGTLVLPAIAVAQDPDAKSEEEHPEEHPSEHPSEHPAEHAEGPMGAPEEMKHFVAMDGVYDVDYKFKMDPAAEEWTKAKALATFSMVLDGCAQKMTFEGDMMGMKFSGLGLLSYNRETKKYTNSWIDNMAAVLSVTEGDMADGKMILTGTDMMHGAKVHSRMTTFNMTDKGFDWTMESSTDGENYATMMTATYTKR